MKIGVLSDAHGNFHTLQKCFDVLVKQVNDIYYLGDFCGYFPDYVNVTAFLKNHGVKSVLGNHDQMLLGNSKIDVQKNEIYQLPKNINEVNRLTIDYLKNLPPYISLDYHEQKILFVHGSPTDYFNEYVFENSNFNHWKDIPYNLILMGHTHRPYITHYKDKTFINVGSCGLPRDNGNMFSMAILDLEKKDYQIKRIKIDPKEILKKYPNVHSSVKNCLKRNNL